MPYLYYLMGLPYGLCEVGSSISIFTEEATEAQRGKVIHQSRTSRTRSQTQGWCDQLPGRKTAERPRRPCHGKSGSPIDSRKIGYLQIDPLLQHPLFIELAEETRVGHTEGIACHLTSATSHTTEDIVVQLAEDT